MHIFLIGYMGSGKTTLGEQLAADLGLSWVDLDRHIIGLSGRSIPDIMDKVGELGFRSLELEVLKTALRIPNAVISTGGGTPCFQDNMQLMRKAGIVIYLQLSPKQLASRLKNTTEERPLLKGLKGEALIQHIEEHLALREPYYLQADMVIDAASTDAKQLAAALEGYSK